MKKFRHVWKLPDGSTVEAEASFYDPWFSSSFVKWSGNVEQFEKLLGEPVPKLATPNWFPKYSPRIDAEHQVFETGEWTYVHL